MQILLVLAIKVRVMRAIEREGNSQMGPEQFDLRRETEFQTIERISSIA